MTHQKIAFLAFIACILISGSAYSAQAPKATKKVTKIDVTDSSSAALKLCSAARDICNMPIMEIIRTSNDPQKKIAQHLLNADNRKKTLYELSTHLAKVTELLGSVDVDQHVISGAETILPRAELTVALTYIEQCITALENIRSDIHSFGIADKLLINEQITDGSVTESDALDYLQGQLTQQIKEEAQINSICTGVKAINSRLTSAFVYNTLATTILTWLISKMPAVPFATK